MRILLEGDAYVTANLAGQLVAITAAFREAPHKRLTQQSHDMHEAHLLTNMPPRWSAPFLLGKRSPRAKHGKIRSYETAR